MRNRVILATVLTLAGGPWLVPGFLGAGPIGTPAPGGSAATPDGLAAPDQPAQLDKALAAFRRGDLRATLQWLKQARRESPELAPPAIILASMFFSDEQQEKGRETLEQASVQHPADPEPHLVFGDLAFRAGRLSDAQVQYERGERLVTGLTDSPERKRDLETRALAGLARVAEARGQLDNAQQRYAALLKLDPQHAQAHFRMGNVLFALGRPEEALAELRAAAGLLEQAPSPTLTLAELYNQAGNAEEAERWIGQAIEESPRDARPQLVMARWQLETRNDPEAALAHIERAVQLSPESAEAAVLRGLAAWSLGDYAEAERVFESLALKRPGDARVNNHLAAVLAEKPTPQTKRAWELAQLVASINPRSADTDAAMGWVAYHRGDLEQAEQRLLRAAAAGGGRDAHYYLARTLYRRGRIAQAHEALDRALSADGMFIHARQARQWRRAIGAPEGG